MKAVTGVRPLGVVTVRIDAFAGILSAFVNISTVGSVTSKAYE